MDESYGLLLMDSRGLRLPQVISRLSTSLAQAGVQSRLAGAAGGCLTKHAQCVFDPTAPKNEMIPTGELDDIWSLEAFLITIPLLFSLVMFSFCCWLRFGRKGYVYSVILRTQALSRFCVAPSNSSSISDDEQGLVLQEKNDQEQEDEEEWQSWPSDYLDYFDWESSNEAAQWQAPAE